MRVDLLRRWRVLHHRDVSRWAVLQHRTVRAACAPGHGVHRRNAVRHRFLRRPRLLRNCFLSGKPTLQHSGVRGNLRHDGGSRHALHGSWTVHFGVLHQRRLLSVGHLSDWAGMQRTGESRDLYHSPHPDAHADHHVHTDRHADTAAHRRRVRRRPAMSVGELCGQCLLWIAIMSDWPALRRNRLGRHVHGHEGDGRAMQQRHGLHVRQLRRWAVRRGQDCDSDGDADAEGPWSSVQHLESVPRRVLLQHRRARLLHFGIVSNGRVLQSCRFTG